MTKTLRNVSLLCLLILSVAFPQSYKSVRIAYINSANNFSNTTHRPSVPVAFLERARRAGYTHIMVEFYILDPGDWAHGDYRGNNYRTGDLYLTLKEIMDAVHAGGLKIIPLIGVPGTSGVYPWLFALNGNVDCYASHPDTLPCIASGLAMPDGSRLQPGGFEHIFTEAMKVLHAAYTDANFKDDLEYICLGYSECIDGNSLIWGTDAARPAPAAPAKSIDRLWMDATGKNESFLAIESIKRRVANIRNTGAGFTATRVMIFGDMFSSTFQSAKKNRGTLKTTLLPANADQDFKSKVVAIPWWYHQKTEYATDFNTEAMLREFTDKSIQTIYLTCMSENAGADGVEYTWVIPSYTYGLFEYIRTAQKVAKSTNMIIGYGAAHWATKGYNNDLLWNTMEYLAYGNRVARPEAGFSVIPPGTIGGVKIGRLLCSKTEITQGDYLSVTGQFMFNNNKYNGRLDYPAENMTFYDAVIYCNERSKTDGLKPVYSYSSPLYAGETGEWCTGLSDLTADTSKNGYRLPSPDEWSYIYSAGTSTRYYWGNDWAAGKDFCWSADNSGNPRVSHPVQQKKCNAWNIFDIAGNVAELLCDYSDGGQLKAKYAAGDYEVGTIQLLANRYLFSNSGVFAVQKGSRDGTRGFRVVRKATDVAP